MTDCAINEHEGSVAFNQQDVDDGREMGRVGARRLVLLPGDNDECLRLNITDFYVVRLFTYCLFSCWFVHLSLFIYFENGACIVQLRFFCLFYETVHPVRESVLNSHRIASLRICIKLNFVDFIETSFCCQRLFFLTSLQKSLVENECYRSALL